VEEAEVIFMPLPVNRIAFLKGQIHMNTGRFLSSYLRADDIKKAPKGEVKVTVESAEVEELGKDDAKEEKLVLYFKQLQQGLVLGKTTINTMIEITESEDTDNWIGKEIVLYYDSNVSFGGKRTGGVRIRTAA
jgi:hypothetical protein